MAKPSKPPPGTPVYIPGKGYRHRYGVLSKYPLSEWNVDLQSWARRLDTGLDHVAHLKRCVERLQPGSAWHEWREARFRSLTDARYAHRVGDSLVYNISWVGAGAAGKTADAGCFAFHWWLASPSSSCVALTSTSKQKMRQRVWPIIQECWMNAKQRMEEEGMRDGPHMLNSTMELRADRTDAKHAIFGQAVEAGELGTAIERLKGVHADRIMLVIDEAPGVQEALYHVISNQLKGCREYILVNIGNGPLTRIDPFSRVCTPYDGWSSITVDSEEWRTRAVPEYQLPPGWCLHFDGTKSPNVRAGKTLYPFLYKWEDWLRVRDDPLIQRTPEFWSQDRGFWVPEGFVNTVLSEELIEQGGARGQVAFDGPTHPAGSIDPAYGGDDCMLRFGRIGKLASGAMAVQVDERIVVPLQVDARDRQGRKLTVDQQIADLVINEARKRGVRPEYFGVEATGVGRSVAAFLTQQWGEIVWVESGGRPSELRASEEDERTARDVYDRRITELWFSVAAFVRGRQIGGLHQQDVIEFCSRTYDYVNKKYYLEKKEDLKTRLGHSPDSADSVSILIEVARRHGMETRGPRGERVLSMWDTVINENSRLYDERSMYQPEVPEPSLFDA